MKIRTKLIAALLSFVAVASLPCVAVAAKNYSSSDVYDCKTISATFNNTYECTLCDKDRTGSNHLANIKCTVSTTSFLWYNSSSQVVNAGTYLTTDHATIKVYSSFVNSKGKVVLSDLTSKSVGVLGTCVSSVSTNSAIKRGNVLIYCTKYNSNNVSTYVKYSYK